MRRSLFPKLIEICIWRRHVGAHPDGHQQKNQQICRKSTKTSVTEFFYKRGNLSLEELKNDLNNTFFQCKNCSDGQMSRNKSRNKSFFKHLGFHVNATSRKSLEFNRSLSQNQEPIRNKNLYDISFQLLLYIIKVKYQEDQ